MRTIELRVLCEGPTEQRFVTQVLQPHLSTFGVFARPESLNPRGDGGVVSFDRLRNAIKHDIGRSRPHQCLTTMIDLYGLSGYPGTGRLPGESGRARVQRIEAGMQEGLGSPRFIPYIQVHEFEAFVFVDLEQLIPEFPDGEANDAVAPLRRSVGSLAPEEIDDGPLSAPSKRLMRAIPSYRSVKAIAGPAVARRVGMARLRESCPHFHEWVTKLEALGAMPP